MPHFITKLAFGSFFAISFQTRVLPCHARSCQLYGLGRVCWLFCTGLVFSLSGWHVSAFYIVVWGSNSNTLPSPCVTQLWIRALQPYGDGVNMHSRKGADKPSFVCTAPPKARQCPSCLLVQAQECHRGLLCPRASHGEFVHPSSVATSPHLKYRLL